MMDNETEVKRREAARERSNLWRDARKELPEIGKPIVMKGQSGTSAPHDVFYTAGYYDPEFRPRSPWQDTQNDCISDAGHEPTHWMYVSELEDAVRKMTS